MVAAYGAVVLHALVVGGLIGALLVGFVALLMRVTELDGAGRHLVWTVTLYATALIPLGICAGSIARGGTSERVGVGAPSLGALTEAAPRIGPAGTFAAPATPTFGAPAGARFERRLQPNRAVALTLAAVWLGGALVGLAGLLLGLRRVRGLKRRSSPLAGALADELPWLTANGPREREIYLRLSHETETPLAIGFRRPVILIPTELATHGGLRAIEGLIMHEHAHLRRRDDWSNLVGRCVERLFWFNPLVWYIGRRIALEREIAADDAVAAATGEPAAYARSLWQFAREMRMPEHSAVAPGAFFTRKQLSIRIESLLEPRRAQRRQRPLVALTVGFSALAFMVAAAAGAPALTVRSAGAPAPASTPAAAALAHAASPNQAPNAAQIAHSATSRRAAREAETAQIARDLQIEVAAADAKPLPVGRHLVGADRAPRNVARVPTPPSPPPTQPALPGGGRPDPIALHRAEVELRDCVGCDFHGRDLRGIDLHGSTLTGIDLASADLRGARLDDVHFVGANLSHTQFAGASLVDASMIGTTLDGVEFGNSDTRGLHVVGASFEDLDLHRIDLRSLLSNCNGCSFARADLHGVDLHGMHLVGANFAHADLHGANLSGSTFSGTNFSAANLTNANMRNATFVGSLFEDTNFNGADTDGAIFNGTETGGHERP